MSKFEYGTVEWAKNHLRTTAMDISTDDAVTIVLDKLEELELNNEDDRIPLEYDDTNGEDGPWIACGEKNGVYDLRYGFAVYDSDDRFFEQYKEQIAVEMAKIMFKLGLIEYIIKKPTEGFIPITRLDFAATLGGKILIKIPKEKQT